MSSTQADQDRRSLEGIAELMKAGPVSARDISMTQHVSRMTANRLLKKMRQEFRR